MDDLVTWLRACLDEDEAWARATEGDEVADWLAGETRDNGEPEVGTHFRRWLPSRVLAEVEAKRRILDMWRDPDAVSNCWDVDEAGERYHYEDGRDPDERDAQVAEAERIDDVVRLLALPYASEPRYRSEWRPDGR